MSYRELWVLVQYLPQESWTQTVLRDKQILELVNPAPDEPEKFGPRTLLNDQMAILTDAVRHMEVTLMRVFGNDAAYPEPTPRPGLQRLVRRQSDAAVAYLKKLRGRG